MGIEINIPSNRALTVRLSLEALVSKIIIIDTDIDGNDGTDDFGFNEEDYSYMALKRQLRHLLRTWAEKALDELSLAVVWYRVPPPPSNAGTAAPAAGATTTGTIVTATNGSVKKTSTETNPIGRNWYLNLRQFW